MSASSVDKYNATVERIHDFRVDPTRRTHQRVDEPRFTGDNEARAAGKHLPEFVTFQSVTDKRDTTFSGAASHLLNAA